MTNDDDDGDNKKMKEKFLELGTSAASLQMPPQSGAEDAMAPK